MYLCERSFPISKSGGLTFGKWKMEICFQNQKGNQTIMTSYFLSDVWNDVVSNASKWMKTGRARDFQPQTRYMYICIKQQVVKEDAYS